MGKWLIKISGKSIENNTDNISQADLNKHKTSFA